MAPSAMRDGVRASAAGKARQVINAAEQEAGGRASPSAWTLGCSLARDAPSGVDR